MRNASGAKAGVQIVRMLFFKIGKWPTLGAPILLKIEGMLIS